MKKAIFQVIITAWKENYLVLEPFFMAKKKNRSFFILFLGEAVIADGMGWKTICSILRKKLKRGFTPIVLCSGLPEVQNGLRTLLENSMLKNQVENLSFLKKIFMALGKQLGIPGINRLLKDDLETLKRTFLGLFLTRELTATLKDRIFCCCEIMVARMGYEFLKKEGLSVQLLEPVDCLQTKDAKGFFRNTARKRKGKILIAPAAVSGDAYGNRIFLGSEGGVLATANIAVQTDAVHCEFWTESPGIFSADPEHIPSAFLLKNLSYEEAEEIAGICNLVPQPKPLAILAENKIPLSLHSIHFPELEGTNICFESPDFGPQVKALVMKKGLTLLAMENPKMWHTSGFLADLFALFKKYGFSINLVSTSETNVTISLDQDINKPVKKNFPQLLEGLQNLCKTRIIQSCAALSFVGKNIRGILHQLGPALAVFQEQKVHLVSQAANDLNFTIVVDEAQAGQLLPRLHSLLFGKGKEHPILGPAWSELFGPAALPIKVKEKKPWWSAKKGLLLKMAKEITPLFVYAKTSMQKALTKLKRMKTIDRLLYSMKANSNPEVLNYFFAKGIGFECVSLEEIKLLLHLFPDIAPKRIFFTPNFAPHEEYKRAFAIGVFVTLDNIYPLQAWGQLFAGKDIFLRLDPGQGRGHHEYVKTAGARSKFGISLEQVEILQSLLCEHNTRVIGLHAHAGSGNLDVAGFSETALFLSQMAAQFPYATVLNIGGGLGIPEKPGQIPLNLEELDQDLQKVKKAFTAREFWLEPGRYFIGEAGVLLTRVTQIKQKGDINFVGINAGMNSLIRPALYGSYHPIVNLSRLEKSADFVANIVGPICESGDTLGFSRPIVKPAEGDILLIANAGAYGRVMSSNYNSRPPAAEKFIP
ncbi:bifunctional aspartate kinase/diaminopimelate decarboxylase [Candidatus Riflebacteria bacterium]